MSKAVIVVEALLNKLGSGILEEYARIHGISRKLKKWKGTLQRIHAVVDSAEERQVCGVNDLLDKLLEVAYDMEALLNLFAVDAKKEAMKAETRSSKLPSCLIACFSKMNPRTLLSDHSMASEIEEIDNRLDEVFRLMASEIMEIDNRLDEVFRLKGILGLVENPRAQSSHSSKLPSCLIACFSKMNPRILLSDHPMASEMMEIDNRLDEVFRLKGLLGLVENPRAQSSAAIRRPRSTSTSFPEGKLFGREEEMKEILVRLIGSDGANDRVPPYDVVSIVGMGGIGKTALAKALYNHESVSGVFERRAWACVSEDFDLVSITKSLLDLIAPSFPCHGKDLHWLQNSLKEHVSGKKFLIVLDDVWNKNYCVWQSLLKPFHSARRGSRILVTSRNYRVAVFVGDRDPKVLDFLSSEDCLSLLVYQAKVRVSFESQPRLRDIAEELAEKCSGLPLSAVTIGWLLRFEKDDKKWKHVLDKELWKKEG